MSRIAHPNVMALRAARVLPPGALSCLSLQHQGGPRMHMDQTGPCTPAQRKGCAGPCRRLHAGDAAGGGQPGHQAA